VGVYDSYFTDLTGSAFKHTVGAGIGQVFFRWDVQRNRFQDCPTIFDAVAVQYLRLMDNTFVFASGSPTLVCDFTGGKENVVVGNSFNIAAASFDPAGGVTGTATDVWSNTLTDAIETGLPTN
jgi:hypothetical protein